MDDWYVYEQLNGDEAFFDDSNPLGFTVSDFWRYSFSNLIDMVGDVAEFLVGKALGKVDPDNKKVWTLFDIDYNGAKVEVKATSYTHTWTRKQSSARSFDISPTGSQRNCDIYVFCLLGHYGELTEECNPLNIQQWRFYIVPCSVINERCKLTQKRISLSRIVSLGYQPVSYPNIKAEVDRIIAKDILANS